MRLIPRYHLSRRPCAPAFAGCESKRELSGRSPLDVISDFIRQAAEGFEVENFVVVLDYPHPQQQSGQRNGRRRFEDFLGNLSCPARGLIPFVPSLVAAALGIGRLPSVVVFIPREFVADRLESFFVLWITPQLNAVQTLRHLGESLELFPEWFFNSIRRSY
jgi:hypothetical protein